MNEIICALQLYLQVQKSEAYELLGEADKMLQKVPKEILLWVLEQVCRQTRALSRL
jgi:hypothetical protein